MRWCHRHEAILEDQVTADMTADWHHIGVDLCRQLQCIRPDLYDTRALAGTYYTGPRERRYKGQNIPY